MHRVRLTDGPNPHTGEVEIYTNSTGGLDNGEWRAICGDYYNWGLTNARVVCHQLGYPDVVNAIRYGQYGEGIGPYWLDSLDCLGTETDILECRNYGIENQYCYYGSAAAECLGMYVHTLLL